MKYTIYGYRVLTHIQPGLNIALNHLFVFNSAEMPHYISLPVTGTLGSKLIIVFYAPSLLSGYGPSFLSLSYSINTCKTGRTVSLCDFVPFSG